MPEDLLLKWKGAALAVAALERLAVELYPLSQAQLQRIAATHAPPAEWYAGEEELLIQEWLPVSDTPPSA